MKSTNEFLKQARLIGVADLAGYVEPSVADQCLKLTIGEPSFDTDETVKQAVIDALSANDTHYAPAQGVLEVRRAIAAFERTVHNVHYDEDEILLTQGSTEGISAVLFTLLNPGDEVIIPVPAYPLYVSIIEMAGAKVVEIAMNDRFEMDIEALAHKITPKTKAIILTSPNNPTGTIFPKANLEAMRQLFAQHEMYVIVDEIYNQILYTEYHSFAQFSDMKENIIVIQSLSKAYAMTGWRLGYVMCSRHLMEEVIKWHHNVMVSVTSFIQPAVIAALKTDNTHMVEAYRERRDFMYRRLIEMGFDVVCPDGAFYIFPSIKFSKLDSKAFCVACAKEAGLMLVPGYCFGSDDHVRLSFCYQQETIEEGLNRLEQFIQQFKLD